MPTNHIDAAVGARCAALRESAGLTLDQATARLYDRHGIAVPLTALSKLENGRRRLQFVEAVALADIYSAPLDAFRP